jgi:hypothetical protein
LIAFRADLTRRSDHHEVVSVQSGQGESIAGTKRSVPCRVDLAHVNFQFVRVNPAVAGYGAAANKKEHDAPVGTHLPLAALSIRLMPTHSTRIGTRTTRRGRGSETLTSILSWPRFVGTNSKSLAFACARTGDDPCGKALLLVTRMTIAAESLCGMDMGSSPRHQPLLAV